MSRDEYMKKSEFYSLMEKMANKMHYPILGFGGGADLTVGDIVAKDVAIGTVIPGFLYADGTVYNIADYPQLAAHYASHHGAANFYGGDGVTTFAVPDLRGEFIRGCGTNGHSGEGNGSAPGVHQTATRNRYVTLTSDDSKIYTRNVKVSPFYPDNYVENNGAYGINPSITWDSAKAIEYYTSRPTNTSYPFYIKATVGHTYSTTEQPVGTDENGDVIYEKTIENLSLVFRWTSQFYAYCTISTPIANVKRIKEAKVYNSISGAYYSCTIEPSSNSWFILIMCSDGGGVTCDSMTIQYTKTTD